MSAHFFLRLLGSTAAAAALALPLLTPPAASADWWRPRPPSDTQPPTTPTNVHLESATRTSVTIAWNASTDNRGVQQYTVSPPEYYNPSASAWNGATQATVGGLLAGT
jgi:chitinase